MVDVNAAQQFYITTTSTPADDRPRVLKYGDLFAVFNRHGDIESFGLGEEGLFYEGTRFLSELVLYLGNSRPLLLTSTISGDNFLFSADLTNVDITDGDEVAIPRGTLHLHEAQARILFIASSVVVKDGNRVRNGYFAVGGQRIDRRCTGLRRRRRQIT